MSKEQIEEVFKDLCEAPTGGVNEDFTIGTLKESHTNLFIRTIAGHLVSLNYRKQSEGEWVYHECVSSYDGVKSGYSCSRCNAFVDENVFDTDEFHKGYCGNCGAKMKVVIK